MKILLPLIITMSGLSAFADSSDYVSIATGNIYKNVSVVTSGPNKFGLGQEIGSEAELEKCNIATSEMVKSIKDQDGLILEASCDFIDGLTGRVMVVVFKK